MLGKQEMSDDVGHDRPWPQNNLLSHSSILHDLHCACVQAVGDAVHPRVESKQSAWKPDRQWVPQKYLKYLLTGLRWDIPPQRIWNSHIILHSFITVLVKFQIEITFSIELHGNSKLSMTSCPPSSGRCEGAIDSALLLMPQSHLEKGGKSNLGN